MFSFFDKLGETIDQGVSHAVQAFFHSVDQVKERVRDFNDETHQVNEKKKSTYKEKESIIVPSKMIAKNISDSDIKKTECNEDESAFCGFGCSLFR